MSYMRNREWMEEWIGAHHDLPDFPDAGMRLKKAVLGYMDRAGNEWIGTQHLCDVLAYAAREANEPEDTRRLVAASWRIIFRSEYITAGEQKESIRSMAKSGWTIGQAKMCAHVDEIKILHALGKLSDDESASAAQAVSMYEAGENLESIPNIVGCSKKLFAQALTVCGIRIGEEKKIRSFEVLRLMEPGDVTIYSIAKKFGVSYHTVIRVLSRRNNARLYGTSVLDEDPELAEKLYYAGEPVKKIAAVFVTTAGAVSRWYAQRNMKRNPGTVRVRRKKEAQKVQAGIE